MTQTAPTAPGAPGAPGALAAVNVSRVIRAPRRAVFNAWRDPAIFSKWWLNQRCEAPMALHLDARPGGKYCIVMTSECGPEHNAPPDYRWVIDGEFLEVVEPERLVFTWRVNDPGVQPTDQRVTVRFEDHPDGTLVSITHTGIVAPHVHKGTVEGWGEMLGYLAGALEAK